MNIYAKDRVDDEIILEKLPLKIISVVPSQTELLYYFGLEEKVIGITKFCIHPDSWFRNKTRIGGTKTLNIARIKTLEPDIVFANKEENVKEQIEALREICPVYVSDINNLVDARKMIEDVGKLTGKSKEAAELVNKIDQSFQQLKPAIKIKAAYLIWQEPYMTVGGDTFISDMMQRCGLQNIFAQQTRYPQVIIDQLREMNCELLLLSSEPFPFTQHHAELLKPLLPNTKIILADGEMFSWYGSRLLLAAPYFQSLVSKLV